MSRPTRWPDRPKSARLGFGHSQPQVIRPNNVLGVPRLHRRVADTAGIGDEHRYVSVPQDVMTQVKELAQVFQPFAKIAAANRV